MNLGEGVTGQGFTRFIPNDPPTFSGSAAFSVAENGTVVGAVSASAPDAQDAVTGYALSGVVAALFSISAAGEIAFLAAPDYESPSDADGDNVYEVTVTATGGSGDRALTATQDVTVTVIPQGVCDRTAQVRDKLVNVTGKACDAITAADLATVLELDLAEEDIASLQSGDFDGLTGLQPLRLHGNDLAALPEDIFADLSSLTTFHPGGESGSALHPRPAQQRGGSSVGARAFPLCLMGDGKAGSFAPSARRDASQPR